MWYKVDLTVWVVEIKLQGNLQEHLGPSLKKTEPTLLIFGDVNLNRGLSRAVKLISESLMWS